MSVINVGTGDSIQVWVEKTNLISDGFGDLEDLPNNSDSIIEGINDMDAAVGNPASLTTVDQTSLVAAINEIKAKAFAYTLTFGVVFN